MEIRELTDVGLRSDQYGRLMVTIVGNGVVLGMLASLAGPAQKDTYIDTKAGECAREGRQK